MLGDTVSITVNAVAKTLAKINQDGYSSEYYLRETLQEFRMKIRHSKDRPAADGTVVDRHNVELTQTVYATSTTPEIIRRSYVVITNRYNDDATALGHLQAAVNGFMTTANVAKFANWES
jgi:hypothetical protein